MTAQEKDDGAQEKDYGARERWRCKRKMTAQEKDGVERERWLCKRNESNKNSVILNLFQDLSIIKKITLIFLTSQLNQFFPKRSHHLHQVFCRNVRRSQCVCRLGDLVASDF